MFYVYILKSDKDDKLYIGYSSDLKLRIEQHLKGKVNATKHRKPLKLIYYEAYLIKEVAQKREMSLKKFGSSYKSLTNRILRV